MADSQRTRRPLSEQHRKKLSEAAKARVARGWKPPRRPRIVIVDEARLRELYLSGLHQSQCAQILGVSPKQIRRALKEYGIPIRKVIEPTKSFGDANHNWKGDAVGYRTLHRRVQTRRGKPKQCEACGTTDPSLKYEWASMTRNYSDPNDYRRMCRPCHYAFDRPLRMAGVAAYQEARRNAAALTLQTNGEPKHD